MEQKDQTSEIIEHEELLPVAELLAASLPPQEPQPPQEQPEPEQPPEEPSEDELSKANPSKKRILLGVTAAVTALALIIGAIFLLRPKQEAPIAEEKGFYLPTKITEYYPDGTPGFCQTTYTYDHRGFPLSLFKDSGSAAEQIWNDDLGIFETIYTSFDGKPDITTEFAYNEKGDILYRVDSVYEYDDEGNLTFIDIDYNNRDQNFRYEYDIDGKIASIMSHGILVGGGTGSRTTTLFPRYDGNGRLVEISTDSENNAELWANPPLLFSYDAAGRLTTSSNRLLEGTFYYQYDYDEAGRLTNVRLMHQYILYVDIESGYVNTGDTLVQEAVFAYDDQGRLASRTVQDPEGKLIHRTDSAYQNGKLSTVTFHSTQGGADIVYRFAQEGNGQDITLVLDDHGNIIRQIRPDGSYIEYEYQRFDLSPENIQRAKNANYAAIGVDAMGDQHSFGMPEYSGGCGYLADLPYPTTVLYEIDVLRHQ